LNIVNKVNIIIELSNRLWFKANDKISLQYTGTESNVSSSGWSNFFSKTVTGVQRYLNKNYSDNLKN
jgi:hypothetical protein